MKILPVGSFVRLKNADKNAKVMVVGRGAVTETDGVTGYYDYLGSPHIAGVTENRYFYFNHEHIEEILFEGYVDELELTFQKDYQEKIKSITIPRFEY